MGLKLCRRDSKSVHELLILLMVMAGRKGVIVFKAIKQINSTFY